MNFRTIELTNGMFTIVDEESYEKLSKFTWYAKKWHRSYYARTRIKTPHGWKDIAMHRLVARTPPNKACHHINFDSLDNREKNLLNMSFSDHNEYHKDNHLRIKFERNKKKDAQ